jgi:hypothetical protein
LPATPTPANIQNDPETAQVVCQTRFIASNPGPVPRMTSHLPRVRQALRHVDQRLLAVLFRWGIMAAMGTQAVLWRAATRGQLRNPGSIGTTPLTCIGKFVQYRDEEIEQA